MVKIHGIYEQPSVHKEHKTTIVKGVIHRETIWKDTIGNEFDQVGSKFVLKKPAIEFNFPFQFTPQENNFEYQIQTHDLDIPSESFVFCCFLILILSAFLIGLGMGYKRKKCTCNERETQKDQLIRKINSGFSSKTF
jgi:hypothetical protein